MTSTLVFLSCLGVLVPEQSPKLPDEPTEAQLLAMITNAYKENYGKVQNLKVELKTITKYPNDESKKDISECTLYLRNGNFKWSNESKTNNSGFVVVRKKDQFTVFQKNDPKRQIFIGGLEQGEWLRNPFADPSCYGNKSNFESIPDLLTKLENKNVEAKKINGDINEILISGSYQRISGVKLVFLSDNKFLCSKSSFVSNGSTIDDFKFTVKYGTPKGANFIYPITYTMNFTVRDVAKGESFLLADSVTELSWQIDNTITDDMFEIKTPEGFKVIDLTKNARRPRQIKK